MQCLLKKGCGSSLRRGMWISRGLLVWTHERDQVLNDKPGVKGDRARQHSALGDTDFLAACEHGDLDIVEFLTASPELKAAGHEWVDIRRGAVLKIMERIVEGARIRCCNGLHGNVPKSGHWSSQKDPRWKDG